MAELPHALVVLRTEVDGVDAALSGLLDRRATLIDRIADEVVAAGLSAHDPHRELAIQKRFAKSSGLTVATMRSVVTHCRGHIAQRIGTAKALAKSA